jgi:predicted metal-dependent hydrolase
LTIPVRESARRKTLELTIERDGSVTLAAYVDRVGRRPTETHIQDLGFRWGSANRRGHLYFHWRVALLPPEMIEYVVAHELAHLVERYHSPAFWERLERVMPDYAARKRWLAAEGGAYDV